jgi:hypothetical protein
MLARPIHDFWERREDLGDLAIGRRAPEREPHRFARFTRRQAECE